MEPSQDRQRRVQCVSCDSRASFLPPFWAHQKERGGHQLHADARISRKSAFDVILQRQGHLIAPLCLLSPCARQLVRSCRSSPQALRGRGANRCLQQSRTPPMWGAPPQKRLAPMEITPCSLGPRAAAHLASMIASLLRSRAAPQAPSHSRAARQMSDPGCGPQLSRSDSPHWPAPARYQIQRSDELKSGSTHPAKPPPTRYRLSSVEDQGSHAALCHGNERKPPPKRGDACLHLP